MSEYKNDELKKLIIEHWLNRSKALTSELISVLRELEKMDGETFLDEAREVRMKLKKLY